MFSVGEPIQGSQPIDGLRIGISEAKLADKKLVDTLQSLNNKSLPPTPNTIYFITGASQSISLGCAVTKKALALGATVIIAGSRSLSEIQELAKTVMAEVGFGKIIPIQLDQGNTDDMDAFIKYCKEHELKLNYILPFGAKHNPKLFIQVKNEDIDSLFKINVRGIYYLATQTSKLIPKSEPWKFVVPLSPNDGRIPASGFYPATKKALEPLVKQANNEFAFRKRGSFVGIRMGWTRTGMMKDLESFIDKATNLGLLVYTPEEMAEIVLLALVEQSSFSEDVVYDVSGNLGKYSVDEIKSIFVS